MASEATYIKVKGYENFQHYKDRNPPWIKLYNSLLDDYEFATLPDEYKAHLMAIWLLASRMNNRIPNDASWISRKINATSGVNLQALLSTGFIEAVHDASESLQAVENSACLETETEESREETACSATSGEAPEPTVLSFDGLCDGNQKDWHLFAGKLAEWEESYPHMDVLAECARARQWLRDNPKRRKTAPGMPRFLGNWLSRAQDGGRFAQRCNGDSHTPGAHQNSHSAICVLIDAAINRRAGSTEDEELQALYARHRALLESRDTEAAETMLRELESE